MARAELFFRQRRRKEYYSWNNPGTTPHNHRPVPGQKTKAKSQTQKEITKADVVDLGDLD
jgi:hypothetical protein